MLLGSEKCHQKKVTFSLPAFKENKVLSLSNSGLGGLGGRGNDMTPNFHSFLLPTY